MRAAPGRALMIIGLTPASAPTFAASAEQLGFITRADDPRRHVIACAGAPICAAAHIAARAIAPAIAATQRRFSTGRSRSTFPVAPRAAPILGPRR